MAAGDLTTLDNAKQWLGITTSTSDALLTRLVTSASQQMQKLMTRAIAVASYSEWRNGMGGDSMMVKNQPIVGVSALSIDSAAIPPRAALGPGATSVPGGYVFDDAMIYLTGYRFTSGRQNVLIAYSAGYAATPPDLEQACLDVVGDWFRYKERIGKTSEGIEGQSIAFSDLQLPKRALGIINAWNNKAPVFR